MYAYCLLPNHFHLLARVKTKEEMEAGGILDLPSLQDLVSLKSPSGNDDKEKEKTYSIPEDTGLLASRWFRLMFMPYAMLDWFGGKEAFEERHRGYIDWKTAGEGWIEEE